MTPLTSSSQTNRALGVQRAPKSWLRLPSVSTPLFSRIPHTQVSTRVTTCPTLRSTAQHLHNLSRTLHIEKMSHIFISLLVFNCHIKGTICKFVPLEQRFSTPVLAPPRSAHLACLCCLNAPDSDHQLIRRKFHE